MNIFLRSKHCNEFFSVHALMAFKVFQKLGYTIINFLFVSLKSPTNFENAYRNPPQNSFLCDWSKFSSSDFSLAAGRDNALELTCHRRLPV
jgi:hypothetical protein